MNISHKLLRKGYAVKFSQLRKHMSSTLNFAYCFTGFIGGGLILQVCQLYMCFKIMSYVVKYTCMLRRYDYTRDHFEYYTLYYD